MPFDKKKFLYFFLKNQGEDINIIMEEMGVEFVNFVSEFGYDKILRVLGRHLRDFLNGLDNLHEYMKFSYPKLRPPSFFIQNETPNGLILCYRSKRVGYLHYVKGQIKQVNFPSKVIIFYLNLNLYMFFKQFKDSQSVL